MNDLLIAAPQGQIKCKPDPKKTDAYNTSSRGTELSCSLSRNYVNNELQN
jgi:hypothetical protein